MLTFAYQASDPLGELVEGTMGKSLARTDLHISQSRDGELFLTSRQDGMIRMLVPDAAAARKR